MNEAQKMFMHSSGFQVFVKPSSKQWRNHAGHFRVGFLPTWRAKLKTKNEESLRKNKRKLWKLEEKLGKWNSCLPETVRLATPLLLRPLKVLILEVGA